MNKPVIIFGAGDFARIAAVYLDETSNREVAAFTVHESHRPGPKLLDWDVVPYESIERTHPPDQFDMLVAIAYKKVNQARAAIYEEVKAKGYRCISYVSPKAAVWSNVEIGENCFIFENNVIQPFVKIGNNVVLWSGNHIGHDSTIGDHCFIASHAVVSGNCKIGPFCFVGVNTTFRDGVTVGARNVIGAGAVIVQDTNDDDVYAVPQTPLYKRRSFELKSFQ